MDIELQAGKNFAWSTIAQVFWRILGLVFFVYISHRLGDAGMGKYGFVTSFVTLWFIFGDMGIGNYLFREWAKGKSTTAEIEKDFNITLTLRLILSAIIFVFFFYFNLQSNRELIVALILFFISTFFAILINLTDAHFQAASRFNISARRQMIEKVVAVVSGFVLLYFWPSLEMAFISVLLGQLVSLLSYARHALPFKFRIVFEWKRGRELFVRGFPFLLTALFASLYNRIDAVMLRYMVSFSEVGWYSTAYRFFDLAGVFPSTLFMSSIFPILSSLYNNKEQAEYFVSFFYKALRILFSSGIITAIFFICFSPYMIYRIFPLSFAPSVLALRILSLSIVIGSLSVIFNSMLLIQHKEVLALKIVVFGALLNIGMNLILIPRYSLYGAAWATVLSELVNVFLLQHFTLWKKDRGFLVRMAIVFAADAIVLLALKQFGLLNNLLAGSALFVGNIFLLFRVGLFKYEDLTFFTTPFKNKFKTMFINQGEV